MGGDQPRHGMPGLDAALATSAARHLPAASNGTWFCGDCGQSFVEHFDDASACVDGHFTPREWFSHVSQAAEDSAANRDA
ncbi:hypothetical protein SAMN04489867_0910 [Pedococcus dokdonensis]|uniref:Uncharacterized protein n=2 Tax=Pedococcus dokdonensis TaxID=443156 RepID=A0A1H0NDQ0_9MICO|nr:hypothetical protein SAMN04489867_0910 [Pedococcus dokdonensis]